MYIRYHTTPQLLVSDLEQILAAADAVQVSTATDTLLIAVIGGFSLELSGSGLTTAAPVVDSLILKSSGSALLEIGELNLDTTAVSSLSGFYSWLTSADIRIHYTGQDDVETFQIDSSVADLAAGGDYYFGDGIDEAHFEIDSFDPQISSIQFGDGQVTVTVGSFSYRLSGAEIINVNDSQIIAGSDDPVVIASEGIMAAVRDYDGNTFAGESDWRYLGAVDVQGDGDSEYVYVNQALGRWATLGVTDEGWIDFSGHGAGGDTRVVGIYIDPLVDNGSVEAGSAFDSQQRFENDLSIDNLALLGGDDYDGDNLQELYFATRDGTAYLHAYMHADGNIQYANYQSEQQMIEFLGANGFGEEAWGGWLG